MSYIELGTFNFYTGKVTVTDPCYDNDPRIQAHWNIKHGNYIGAVYQKDCGVWGERIEAIAICHEDYAPDNIFDLPYERRIDGIGVDAGLAGFFQNKPDYSDNEWEKLCNEEFINKSYGKIDCGFWSSSGYGDGFYDIYAVHNDDHEILALKIVFIEDENEGD